MHRTKHDILSLQVVLIGLILAGCAELKKDLPPPSSPLTVHGEGWEDPASSNFHGKAIRNAKWDMSQCKTCHGRLYDGGVVNVSCRTCHALPGGPENCTTCHGGTNAAPPNDIAGNTSRSAPGVGAHQKHLVGGAISAGSACSECHTVPPSLYSPGHVDSELPAEVPMNGYIATTVTNETPTTDHDAGLPLFSPQPEFDASSISCANTYCHGNFKNGNTAFSPVWNDSSGSQMACGTCHGDVTKATLAGRALPKSVAEGGTHPDSTACSNCHGDVVNSSLVIIDKAKHINGKLNVSGEERDF
ncbi:MAG TPA: CxxxxCH/CxxCH domain-containing protein [Bacteroidota bacterium]|nr:CxxxxCH/CxxCH domain-containing protein [Bacteroidota bacterium]